MRAILIIAAAALLAGCATLPEQPPRFVVENHAVTPQGAEKSISIILKLDSASGDVWRYNGKEFRVIPVGEKPLASVEKATEADLEEKRKSEAVKAKMKEIVIPEMEFRSARITDVIEFLEDASREHDPAKKGINIILDLAIPQKAIEDSSPVTAAADPFAVAASPTEPDYDSIPLVTFKAHDISLQEALQIVTEVCNIRYAIRGRLVMLLPYDCHSSELVHLTYRLRPSTLKNIQAKQPQLFDKDLSRDAISEEWRAYFADFGIGWPRGSSITSLPLIGALFVANTPDNQVKCERIIAAMDAYPPRNGRFLLIPPTPTSQLMLLDTDDGDTWEYNSIQPSKGIHPLEEKFLHIPTR